MRKNGADKKPEDMSYKMLGEDVSSDREKLEKYTGEVGWAHLKPHYENGALLWIDPSLDLAAVGGAFSADEQEKVDGWLKSGDLVKPSVPHARYWEESGARFRALVVSPFVLIQPVADGGGRS